MHTVRAEVPEGHPLERAEFTTISQRLIKIAARVVEHPARIRARLLSSCSDAALFRKLALTLSPFQPSTA